MASTHLLISSNDGQLVGDKFDLDINNAQGRLVGDARAANTAAKVRKSVRRETKRQARTADQKRKAAGALREARARVTRQQARTREAKATYARSIENDQALNPAQRQRRLDELEERHKAALERQAATLARLKRDSSRSAERRVFHG